jgi:hypothetical protein
MESVRSIWTAVWKLGRLFTAYRPAGSVQWDSRQVRLLDPKTGQLLREHLRMALGGHRINDEDRSGKTPLVTQQLLARADKAGSQIGANCPGMHQTQGETSVRRIIGVLSWGKKYGVARVPGPALLSSKSASAITSSCADIWSGIRERH